MNKNALYFDQLNEERESFIMFSDKLIKIQM